MAGDGVYGADPVLRAELEVRRAGVRHGLLAEVPPDDGYLLGRAVMNMSVGAVQICGFALGGVLIPVLSPRGTLLVGAALYVAAALLARWDLRRRRPRTTGRLSPAETWRTNRRLWASVPRRNVYLALWVPNGLIVGCESLFVPFSPGHAGLLFPAAAVGMLVGDTVAGRLLTPRGRRKLGAPLRLLLAAPYLVLVLGPPLPVAVAVVTGASIGYCATLLLQERLMALTPAELSGHALGLHSSGMLAMQGVRAALAGNVAQLTTPSTAMAVMAGLSVAVTLALAPGLRDDLPASPRV